MLTLAVSSVLHHFESCSCHARVSTEEGQGAPFLILWLLSGSGGCLPPSLLPISQTFLINADYLRVLRELSKHPEGALLLNKHLSGLFGQRGALRHLQKETV